MSTTPEEFLACAQSQLVNNNEISFRSAISRAYYAAYHAAQSKWTLDAAQNNGVGMHKAYISQLLQAAPNSNERKIGLKLQTLHGRRIRADYKLAINILPADAVQQINGTHDVFSIISTIS